MSVPDNLHVMFGILYLGYLTTCYLRATVSFASPVIMKSENLENSDIGLILSSQMTGYMVVKVLGGTLVDVLDPGLVLAASLFLGGITGAAFTAFSSVSWFAFLWFLVGMAQGPAWAACGVLLKKNVPSENLATWWSFLSTSINVAGTAGPIVSGLVVEAQGWRTSLLIASSASLGLSAVCFPVLKSSTENKVKEKDDSQVKNENQGSVRDLFRPIPLLVYLIYLLVTVVRGTCNDWGQLYLIQDKGHSMMAGSSFTSSQEIGGIIGSLLTGCMSDYMVKKGTGKTSPRLTLIVGLTIIHTVGLYCFIFHVSATSSQVWINLLSFCIGFGMYSILSLLGICAMEVSPDNLSGSAHSFAALGGNIGRIISGYPLSVVATMWSWQESFCVTLAVSVLCVVTAVLCRKLLVDKERIEKDKTL